MEPTTHTAGDTLTWRRDDLTQYPSAAGWVLAYKLIGPAAAHDIAAVADGGGYLVNVSAATTASWTPGVYTWVATITLGAVRHTLGKGQLELQRNLAAVTTGLDLRGSARKALDAVNAALETYGAKAYLQEVQMGDRRQRFASASEFMAFRSRLIREAAAEDAASGLRPKTSSRLLVRFARR